MARPDAHRPSGLKQQNKGHNKLGHKTKGQVRALTKGRHNCVYSNTRKHELSRLERRNQVKVNRTDKREKNLNSKRKLGTGSSPPFLVCVVMLCPDTNPQRVLSALKAADSEATVTVSSQGATHISCHRFKQRYTFVLPPIDNLYAILDTAKMCSTLLVVWPTCTRDEAMLGEDQRHLLSCINAQGLPTPVHAALGYQDMASKKKAAAQQNLLQEIHYYFPGQDKVKVFHLDKPSEAMLCLRQVGAQKQRKLYYRDHRPHMLVESVELVDDVNSASTGTLKVSGYIRGVPLDVNGLVHIPGWGDYQVARIVQHVVDPHPLVVGNRNENLSQHNDVVIEPNTEQESLTAIREESDEDDNTSDDDSSVGVGSDGGHDDKDKDDGDECRSVKSLTVVPVRTDRIPGAYSAYQAAWMMDNDAYKEDTDSELDDDSEEDEFEPPTAVCQDEESNFGSDEEETMSTTSDAPSERDEAYDEKMDYDVEMEEYDDIQACRDDLEFPDEMDTPRDELARERFHKYRGLDSFRTSPWDLSANLPSEYKKIFHIPHFKRFKKKILAVAQEERDNVSTLGDYITIHIKNVEKHLYKEHTMTGSPLVIFGLLPHEHKMALVHFVLKSHPVGHTTPSACKERLVFHVGFRRFTNEAIYSEHTAGDKQKLCRYFHPGTTVVASVYAPITYPPASVLVFRQLSGMKHELMATGSVYSVNADRCILKRVILTGHPFKIHKRTVVVRYMFFDSNDIDWFKPIELKTKYGRRGKIKQSLGTHGHMKCKFNGTLKSQDTIMLTLYKRVYPKWMYNPHVPACAAMYRADSLTSGSDGEEDSQQQQQELDRVLMPPPAKKLRSVHFS